MSATPVTHLFSRINLKGMWDKLTVLQKGKSTMMLFIKLTQLYCNISISKNDSHRNWL